MATPAYHTGADGIVKSGTTTLPVTKWNMTIHGNTHDVSNVSDGRKRIGGTQDADGDLMMHWDSANNPTAATPDIKDNSVVTLHLITDGSTQEFSLSAIISEVHISSDFAGTIDFSCKFQLESGTVTYAV